MIGKYARSAVDLAAGHVIGDGVGESDLGTGRRDTRELGGVLSDEHRFERCYAVGHGDVPELGRRFEQLAVQGDDEVPDRLTTADLVTGLHGGPRDVVGEVGGEVSSCLQGVQVLVDRAFGLLDTHAISFGSGAARTTGRNRGSAV